MTVAVSETVRMSPGSTFFFSKESRQILYRIMEWKTFQPGTVLFSRNEPADKLFFVIEGEVKIWKEADGKEYVFQIAGKEDLIGEGVSFTEDCHTYQADALTEGKAGIIRHEDIIKAVGCSRDFAVDMLKWTSLMEKTVQAKLHDLTFYGKRGALCSTLLRLAQTYGRDTKRGLLIEKKMKNGDIGSYIGSSRESVNRLLTELKKEKVISQEEGFLYIHNVDYLKEVCRCGDRPEWICRM
ncbi:Crp/Fnr family transcriptional regulator [Alkalicoccus saliphilus]|uniref:Crp/Fnr family transcriptional regulator n=1 Tax=Alkalicoccus saliphilus TaxID=200989 RepID=A0A2T4U5U3_9BACI|nr:Crp/Fnr family transcriptional regulator [Alkalicoccus saliphilus]PTL38764.1 hypothetical protein C6Y45_09740 [Alkalicoccus saliphilus]